MKTIGVTELRQRTAKILEELQEADEPVAILQRSRPAAYLVSAAQYEAEHAELRATRRALFLREVREGEAEYRAGGATCCEGVAELRAGLRRCSSRLRFLVSTRLARRAKNH